MRRYAPDRHRWLYVTVFGATAAILMALTLAAIT